VSDSALRNEFYGYSNHISTTQLFNWQVCGFGAAQFPNAQRVVLTVIEDQG
jgi:hypothetical protein